MWMSEEEWEDSRQGKESVIHGGCVRSDVLKEGIRLVLTLGGANSVPTTTTIHTGVTHAVNYHLPTSPGLSLIRARETWKAN